MADVVTIVTCFGLLISTPGQGGGSFLINGYPTIESASLAKNDIIGYNDAAERIRDERYKASPQYAIDQAREKKEAEDRVKARLKKGCLANEWDPNQPSICQINQTNIGYLSVTSMATIGRLKTSWDVTVFSEPCSRPE